MISKKISGYLKIALGFIAFLACIVGVLFFSGNEEHIITRVAGLVFMLIPFTRLQPGGSRSMYLLNGKRNRVDDVRQNVISAIAIVSALVVGYIVFVSEDSLPNRKQFLVAAAIVLAISYTLAFLPRSLDRSSGA
jgi:hypothetical protein